MLQVISADFVPIEPYNTTSVLIGIGQRYNVVVEANPEYGVDDYWIRTWTAAHCGIQSSMPYYEQTGILRYDPEGTADPTSQPWPNVSSRPCADEPFSSLVPILPWQVGGAANGDKGEEFSVDRDMTAPAYPLAAFAPNPEKSEGFTPLQIG